MDQSGDREPDPDPGLGRRPEGGWPDFRAPGDAGSGRQPPYEQSQYGQNQYSYGQNQYGQNQYGQQQPWQQTESWQHAQPWQQQGSSGRRTPVVLFVIIGALVVALVVAISVILATRNADQPQPVPKPAPVTTDPSTRPTGSAPSTSASPQPATDELAKALQATGLECVLANADPVINICESRPEDSFTELRWMNDGHGTMISFQIYARYKSGQDRTSLTKRIQLMKLSGLGASDISRITSGLKKAKKHTSMSDLGTTWGSVSLQYISPAHAVQLFGDKRGHSDAKYDGKVFDGKPSAIMAKLRKKSYTCSLQSEALTCSHDEVYLSLYGNGKGMTTVNLSGRNPTADKILLGLLPTLLGNDLDAVLPLVQNGMRGSFYLGAVSGYVVIGNTNYVSVEAISW